MKTETLNVECLCGAVTLVEVEYMPFKFVGVLFRKPLNGDEDSTPKYKIACPKCGQVWNVIRTRIEYGITTEIEHSFGLYPWEE